MAERDDTCDGCPSRRSFLQDGLRSALALGAVLTADWTGLAVFSATGEARGDERRYPVPGGDSVTIDSDNQVIIVRYKNVAYAFNLACPHQNTALKWREADHRFQCPKHSSKYQPDGTFISGRATRNMDRLAIRRDGASLVVNVSAMFRSDQDPSGWANAAVALS